jgi:hypothetical protein
MSTPDVRVSRENGKTVVFCRYITRNGKRIYPRRRKVFRFVVSKKA